jgi:hypothetical protein
MQIDMPKAKEKMFFIQIGEVQSGLVSRNKWKNFHNIIIVVLA